MQRAPSFWCGVGCMVIAMFLFLHAFLNQSYGLSFHLGLAMTFSAALFFINHNGWDEAYGFVEKWKKEVFLAVSSSWLALAYEHNWPLLWPGIATAIAVIVFFGWTKPLKETATQVVKKVGRKILKLLTGEFGWGISFIVYVVMIFVFAGPTLMQANPLTGKMLDIAYNLAILFVFLLIGGVILTGEKLSNKKEKE